MNDDSGASTSDESQELPWFDYELQRQVPWRDGDVIVSVPHKSGTTWTMNIVHQLRTGGDPELEDLYVEVPWLELLSSHQDTRSRRLERWAALPTSLPRAFKTHASPPQLPYIEPGEGRPHVRYVVIGRNPEEAVVSLRPFLARTHPAFLEYWEMPPDLVVRDDLETFFEDVVEGMGMGAMIFECIAGWWPLRHRSNVFMMHFSELKADHEGSIRKLADFLGLHPTPEQWPAILEYCSFDWMKAHQDKFELRTICAVPMFESGAMVRKGKVGVAVEDGMTPALAERLRALAERIIDDPRALGWHYHGGPLPPV
ncbi:MAG: sulfotransferase domain-containing protein [Myxococcota bacterium]